MVEMQRFGLLLILVGFVVAMPVLAQQPGDATTEKLEAVVIEVRGKVLKAPFGTPADQSDGWSAVKKDDRLSSGTLVKTSFRSRATLRFGDSTVISIRRVTLASIDDYYRSDAEETIRLGLGYGAIRGGSAEGERRTDLVVDSTVATLAKRGTDGWEMIVNPTINHVKISMSRSGFGEVLASLKSENRDRPDRSIMPGEYVTTETAMRMWMEQDLFDRYVDFFSPIGLTEDENSFASRNPGGRGVLVPGSSADARDFVRRDNPVPALNFNSVLPMQLPRPPFVVRPEGDFGIGNTFNLRAMSAGNMLRRSPATRFSVLKPRGAQKRNMRLLMKR